jgi:protease-4
MTKTGKWILFSTLGLVVLVALFCIILGVTVMSGDRGSSSPVAIVRMEGVISSTEPVVADLKKCLDDPGVKVVIMRLNTPGGVVAPVQEICGIIRRLRDKGKIVIASQESVSASGGYYIACACNQIVTNPGTITGSIGVILSIPSLQGLLEKVGVGVRVIKSGEMKDSGSPWREMTTGEEQVLLTMVMDVYGQFLDHVVAGRTEAIRNLWAKNRNLKPEQISDAEISAFIKSIADGRTFSGSQAVQWGMADRLGSLDDAIDLARELAGTPEDKSPPREFAHRKGLLAELLTENPVHDVTSTFTEVSIRFQLY